MLSTTFVLLTSQAEVNPERGDTNTGSDRSLFIVMADPYLCGRLADVTAFISNNFQIKHN